MFRREGEKTRNKTKCQDRPPDESLGGGVLRIDGERKISRRTDGEAGGTRLAA